MTPEQRAAAVIDRHREWIEEWRGGCVGLSVRFNDLETMVAALIRAAENAAIERCLSAAMDLYRAERTRLTIGDIVRCLTILKHPELGA